MIELSDGTMIEADGEFSKIAEIMSDAPGEWMLVTDAFVMTDAISAHFTLHLWNDGRVVITETEHPLTMEAPDDDIVELKRWCESKGWKKLMVEGDLLDDVRAEEFWKRYHTAGIISSEVFEEADKEEAERQAKLTAQAETNQEVKKDGDQEGQ